MITYSEKEEKIILSGLESIDYALHNGNEEEVLSILFCLDKYLDPYFKYDLAYSDEIFKMLERMVFEEFSLEAKLDIIHLLAMYCYNELSLIKENFDRLPKEIQNEIIGSSLI